MNTILFRAALVLSALLTLTAQAAEDPIERFSAKERAQGYVDATVIARPLAATDGPTEIAETNEGMVINHRFQRLGNTRVLRLPRGETVEQAVKRLRATGRYAYVEPDRILYSHVQPNDGSFGQQWALNNTGQSGGTAGADIRAVSAWDTQSTAPNVIVGVIDSGIRLAHLDLKDNLWSQAGTGNHGISATNGNGTTTTNPDDEDGHGTHVAGIIGASGNNGRGVSGVAWNTRLMALKFLTTDGAGSTSDAIKCIDFAITNGVSIINASFGSDRFSQAEFDAVKRARDAGVIVVASAGNDGLLNDTNEDYPANYALDNIVAVAATTRTDALAGFSNYGSGLVELAAPGAEILSTYADSNDSYATLSGTSMSAPHVSGALALLKARFPGDTYRQLINRLLRSTSKTTALRGKVQTGGRLNLAQALTSTSNRPFNDDFDDRAVMDGPNVRIRSHNEGATNQTGEPQHANVTGGTSLWWSWTAPESSLVAFDTTGSSYDTVLGIYTGSSLNGLTSVASNDNASGSINSSRVVLNVTGGTTYQIAVAGRTGATGYTSLRIGTVPANNDFAGAKLLVGESIIENSTLLNATSQSGEPKATSNAAGHSVWYRWVAPKSGMFALSPFATAIDTVAGVYTGSAVGSLTLVGSNDDPAANPSNSDALVMFNATSGTTYYFLIDHAANSSDSLGGDFILTLTDAAWAFPATDEVTSSPAIGSDGTVYFGAGSDDKHDKNVYAVTPTGAKKWSFETGESGIVGATPAIGSDGTVYVGGTDKIMYALNGATGAKKWSYTAGTPIYSAAAIGADGTIYFRDDTKLYALSSAGSAKWTFNLTGSTDGTYSSPAIGADGTIYVGTNGGAFYAVKDNGSTGTEKWKFTGDGDIFTSPSIASDGTLYLATLNGKLYALTDNGGSVGQRWTWTAQGNSSITSSIAIAADGTLYFAAYDHKLYALSSNGTQKWAYTLGDEVRASSPAVAADGTVYVGCYDSKVYAVNSNGTLQRVFATAKPIRSSPAIAGNRLYIGSADAKLYAFEINQTAAASAWPMFHQNTGRTGRLAATPLTIVTQPQSKTVASGSTLTLSITATSSAALTYQWFKDGSPIPGATNATLSITGVSALHAGSYTVRVTSGGENVLSSAEVVNVLPPGTVLSSFANIATRAYCSTVNKVTIGGFVVAGSAPKRVLVRALGPSLVSAQITASEVLADPAIEVYKGATRIYLNDNWGDNSNTAEITATAAAIGAGPLAAGDTKSAMLLLTLDPGVYTFIVRGNAGTSGIVLLEVFDADGSLSSKFVNIATRAYATTGNGVAIGGFVISGSVSKNILVRAVGPSLSKDLPVGELLADPEIELHKGAPVIASNDNWTAADNRADIVTTAARIGATPLDSADTTSSALLTNLDPGVYTFIARGKAGSSGIVLVEIYDAD